MTAILAPRFLASAFSAGPALLILFCFLLRKFTKFDAGREPIQKVAQIVTYAMAVNMFFVLMELFTAIYSNMPEHVSHFQYLFMGIGGQGNLVPWMWTSVILGVVSLVLLIVPKTRQNEQTLILACVMLFISLWIDKGLALIVAGFVPNPLAYVVEYVPTIPELGISVAVYAMGLLIVTGLYKIALSVRKQLG